MISNEKRSGTKKTVHIITTAAIPWLTGTAINPLQRADQLAHLGFDVTLIWPWIEPEQQVHVFPKGVIFHTEAAQLTYVRKVFLTEPLHPNLSITFYQGRYSAIMGSIFPRHINLRYWLKSDIVFLEEPEHLLLFKPHWRLQSKHPCIVGILHTNYAGHVAHYSPAWLKKNTYWLLNGYLSTVIRRSCTHVIALSPVLQHRKEFSVVDIHGVRTGFLHSPLPANHIQIHRVYFVGKITVAKGLLELIDLLENSMIKQLDIFGEGEDKGRVKAYAQQRGINIKYKGSLIKPWEELQSFSLFINPSMTEVYCTTTAEALALHKFVLIPRHPSNAFFYHFKNCYAYRNKAEFLRHLAQILNHRDFVIDRAVKELSWARKTATLLQCLNIQAPITTTTWIHLDSWTN